jgi:hypothetical protein
MTCAAQSLRPRLQDLKSVYPELHAQVGMYLQ